jgi:hypothetical protein
MQAERVPVGRTPRAILTIYNMSDHILTISDRMYRVYVYGKDGEAPSTLIERQITGRLRQDDVPLREDRGFPEAVFPAGGAGDSCVRNFDLTYLYDLSTPGRYTAYAEVMDPSSHRWLRTRTVTFEMTTPSV